MTTTVWILGDQLTPQLSSLAELERSETVILMIESLQRARQLPYHKQKLTFIWSAMRHFAIELQEKGYTVDYYQTQERFGPALSQHLEKYQPNQIRLMESAEYGGSGRLSDLIKRHNIDLEITPNNMFLSHKTEFAKWAKGKKTLLMETFYRRMRRQTGLLMDDDDPTGGDWNYDKQNRQTPPRNHQFPELPTYEPDPITREVVDFVESEFPNHFGNLAEFWLPVTRQDADHFFEDFLDQRLDLFGPYEDAMVKGERALYHSLLSSLINIGLLDPLELCRQAENRYRQGRARLNSVEGFIRQIIGWREYMYQIYQWQMPGYLETNHFEADIPLPDFYWTAETDMLCVADAVKTLQTYGVNHHIQRLMVTGNLALIAGFNPQQVNEWYWLAYIDAYEWVVSPNVLGMALYADGGMLATKPYAASANYINKMSNYCKSCAYNHRQAIGENACPFNSLYWDFLARNQTQLNQNSRMNLVMANLKKQDQEKMKALREQAEKIRHKFRHRERV